jgi:hypothetical protein
MLVMHQSMFISRVPPWTDPGDSDNQDMVRKKDGFVSYRTMTSKRSCHPARKWYVRLPYMGLNMPARIPWVSRRWYPVADPGFNNRGGANPDNYILIEGFAFWEFLLLA